jgi:uncharacterized membrane protein HdeD (DUF308 family)
MHGACTARSAKEVPMSPVLADPIMLRPLAERWWAVLLRGIAAILFGVLAIAVPGASLLALVILWGAYALADGVLALVQAARSGRAGGRWGWFLFEGLVSIAAGVLAFVWPGITALALLLVIAAWAILTGLSEIVAAARLRRHIQGEWLLALSGVLSISFGVLLLVRPQAGALAVVWLIGSYAVLFGVLLVALSLRLHRWHRAAERPVPRPGAPSYA